MDEAGAARPVHRWRASLTVLTVVFLFFAPAFQPGVQFLHRDQGRLHHPVKQYVAEELARGRFPQWIPEAGLGMPVVAGTVDMMLHPFHLLLVTLPFELGLTLWLVAAVALAGLGARWLAGLLGASEAGGLAAGLAFALSGYLVSSTDNMQYLSTAAAIPWLLGATLQFTRSPGPAPAAGLLAASFLAAAGGDPQGWGSWPRPAGIRRAGGWRCWPASGWRWPGLAPPALPGRGWGAPPPRSGWPWPARRRCWCRWRSGPRPPRAASRSTGSSTCSSRCSPSGWSSW